MLKNFTNFINIYICLVDCNKKNKLESIIQRRDSVNNSRQWPNAAHDIRIETYAKANGFPDSYRLSVDMSWQTPPNSKIINKNFKFLRFNKIVICFLA